MGVAGKNSDLHSTKGLLAWMSFHFQNTQIPTLTILSSDLLEDIILVMAFLVAQW